MLNNRVRIYCALGFFFCKCCASRIRDELLSYIYLRQSDWTVYSRSGLNHHRHQHYCVFLLLQRFKRGKNVILFFSRRMVDRWIKRRPNLRWLVYYRSLVLSQSSVVTKSFQIAIFPFPFLKIKKQRNNNISCYFSMTYMYCNQERQSCGHTWNWTLLDDLPWKLVCPKTTTSTQQKKNTKITLLLLNNIHTRRWSSQIPRLVPAIVRWLKTSDWYWPLIYWKLSFIRCPISRSPLLGRRAQYEKEREKEKDRRIKRRREREKER